MDATWTNARAPVLPRQSVWMVDSDRGQRASLVVIVGARGHPARPRTYFVLYMRLMEEVAPAPEGDVRVEVVSNNQYRELNEFPLSEQSRPWAAFGNARGFE